MIPSGQYTQHKEHWVHCEARITGRSARPWTFLDSDIPAGIQAERGLLSFHE